MDKAILRHRHEFASDLRNRDYEVRDGGVLFTRKDVFAKGVYFHSVNGQDCESDPNLLPDQTLTGMLSTFFGAGTKPAAWYCALFAAAVTPQANLTAASFAATMSEITSAAEGYSEATRPQWVPGAAAGNAIDNLSSKAQFSIVTASQLTVNGAALLSDNTKGGTSGLIGSCSRFAATRTLYNGDVFDLGYEVSLSS